MRVLLWVIAGLVSVYSNKDIDNSFDIITTYFGHRNIKSLNVFVCTEQEGVWLLRKLLPAGFFVKVKRVLTEKDEEPNSYYKKGWFINLNCSKNMDFFNNISGHDGVWLGFPTDSANLNLSRLRLDSDVVVGSEDGLLWDLYAKPSGPYSEEAGTWRPPMVTIPDRKKRYDLGGVHLKGVIIEFDLQFYKNNIIEKIGDNNYFPTTETTERVSYVHFISLAKHFNFQIEFVPTDTWGFLLPNGSFAGMAGVLQRKEAEFGVTTCAFRMERLDVLSYIPPLQKIRFICMFMEETVHGSFLSLLIPFSYDLWLCTFAALVVGAAMYYLLKGKGPMDGIIFVTAILTQQGLENDARNNSTRVYSISLLLLGVILYSYYNAAIMYGLLSVQPDSIRTLEDLLRSERTAKIAKVPYMTPTYNHKNYITPETLAKAEENGEDDKMIELKDGVERLRGQKYIMVSDDLALYGVIKDGYTDHEKCGLREFETIRPMEMAHPFQKNSQFRDMMTQGMLRLQETGVAHRERTVWYPPKPGCFGSTIFQQVTIDAVGIAFTIFLGGSALSFLIFLAEVIAGALLKRKNVSKKCPKKRPLRFIR